MGRHGKEKIKVKLIFDKITLITSELIKAEKDMEYLEINIQKYGDKTIIGNTGEVKPEGETLSGKKIIFKPKQEAAEFDLELEKSRKHKVKLEIMRHDEPKTIGKFDVCFGDQLGLSLEKKVPYEGRKMLKRIVVSYKLFKSEEECVIDASTSEPKETLELKELKEPKKNVEPDQATVTMEENFEKKLSKLEMGQDTCIVVVGTTGKGKSTTINLFTGNNVKVHNKAEGCTKKD